MTTLKLAEILSLASITLGKYQNITQWQIPFKSLNLFKIISFSETHLNCLIFAFHKGTTMPIFNIINIFANL